jgi:hypothetical protein
MSKMGANPRVRGRSREMLVFISGNIWLPQHRFRGSGGWWSQSGSNRRPQACKASALPTELWPHSRKFRKFQLPKKQKNRTFRGGALVGRVGVEPTTSRLSGVRSNHLSYRPPFHRRPKGREGVSQLRLHSPCGERFQDEGT